MIESVNWDYWQWMKRRGKLHATRTTAAEANVSEKAVLAHTASLEKRIDELEDDIESIAEEMAERMYFDRLESQRKFENLQKNVVDLNSGLNDVMEAVIEIRKRPAGQVIINEIVNEHFKLKEGHKTVIGILRNAGRLLTYKEISGLTGIPNSSVRVYVADLHKMGFPFKKLEIEGKVLIGVEAAGEIVNEFVSRYS